MLLLWVEYVPHVFIGAAALIVLAVAADFTIAKLKGVSQRLRKAVANEEAKSVEVVTVQGDNAPSVPAEREAAPDAKMGATVDVEELIVRDTGRCLPQGAPTERHEMVLGADTERCEAVATTLEPEPEVSSRSWADDDKSSASASLVARAARELMQARGARLVEDAVVQRDPSVRVMDVDVAVAPSGRVAS
jgi:hypothetical protein